jgi:hypothetical protein
MMKAVTRLGAAWNRYGSHTADSWDVIASRTVVVAVCRRCKHQEMLFRVDLTERLGGRSSSGCIPRRGFPQSSSRGSEVAIQVPGLASLS